VDEARVTLIELRVHASSAAVMSPQGQQRRLELLDKLFELVQIGGMDAGVEPALFVFDKGKKMLADLLALWPPRQVYSTLLSFAKHMPTYVQHKSGKGDAPHVQSFASALASAPKQLPADEAAALLEIVAAHGQAALRAGLGFPELRAFFLGLLCHPAAATPGHHSTTALTSFYAALLPLTASGELVWSFLGAVLPSMDEAHVAALMAHLGELRAEMMSAACLEARAAFVAKLQQHTSSRGGGTA